MKYSGRIKARMHVWFVWHTKNSFPVSPTLAKVKVIIQIYTIIIPGEYPGRRPLTINIYQLVSIPNSVVIYSAVSILYHSACFLKKWLAFLSLLPKLLSFGTLLYYSPGGTNFMKTSNSTHTGWALTRDSNYINTFLHL